MDELSTSMGANVTVGVYVRGVRVFVRCGFQPACGEVSGVGCEVCEYRY